MPSRLSGGLLQAPSTRGNLAVLALSITLLVSAGSPPRAVAQATSEAVATRPASVWKIEKPGHTVYLAGSVHLLRSDDYPIPPVYDEAYADSEKIIFEIDMAVMNSLGAAMKMQQLGSYGPGDSIANHVKPQTMKLLDEYLEDRGMAPVLFHRMKPGMLAMTLSALEAARMGARADLGLEMRYGTKAQADRKETGGLETVEYQIGLFDKLTPKEQEDLLKSTLENLDQLTDGLDKLIKVWRSGDSSSLDEQLSEEFGDSSRLQKLLLIDRNRNWIPDIEKAIAGRENVMFLVGAGHLVGKEGVISLLEARGHRPVQMRYPAPSEDAESAGDASSAETPATPPAAPATPAAK